MSTLIDQQEQVRQRRLAARTAGYNASTYAECPYVSGQSILNDWNDGFLARCIEAGQIPADTPMFLLGRIAYLQGVPCSEMPDTERATGSWFRGWLVQRDLTPEQPNKRPGKDGNLLDMVFG